MAHFRGTLQGNRGKASRLGSKSSGLTVEAQSWQGKCVAYLRHDDKTGKDVVDVILSSHHGNGLEFPRIVFTGNVDGSSINGSEVSK